MRYRSRHVSSNPSPPCPVQYNVRTWYVPVLRRTFTLIHTTNQYACASGLREYLLRVAFHTPILVKGCIFRTGKYVFRVLFETPWTRMISTCQWRWPPGACMQRYTYMYVHVCVYCIKIVHVHVHVFVYI